MENTIAPSLDLDRRKAIKMGLHLVAAPWILVIALCSPYTAPLFQNHKTPAITESERINGHGQARDACGDITGSTSERVSGSRNYTRIS